MPRVLRQGAQGRRHLARGLLHGRVAGERRTGGVRLDQHRFRGRPVVGVGLLQGAFRLAGLTRIVTGHLPAAHQLADGEDRRDHQQPPEDGRFPVPGAPSGDPLDGGCPRAPAATGVSRFGFRQY